MEVMVAMVHSCVVTADGVARNRSLQPHKYMYIRNFKLKKRRHKWQYSYFLSLKKKKKKREEACIYVCLHVFLGVG